MSLYRWTGTGILPDDALAAQIRLPSDWQGWADVVRELSLLPHLILGGEFWPLQVNVWLIGEGPSYLAELILRDHVVLVWLAHAGELVAFLGWLAPIMRELHALEQLEVAEEGADTTPAVC